jgi:hypothetical protein
MGQPLRLSGVWLFRGLFRGLCYSMAGLNYDVEWGG